MKIEFDPASYWNRRYREGRTSGAGSEGDEGAYKASYLSDFIAEHDVKTVSVDIAAGTMGAVRFEVIGTVDGVPRIVVEHVTRTHPDQVPEWAQPTGGGSYRVIVTGEPMMELELAHHGEHGDHNDSGMIVTAQRLINAVPAVVDAEPGLVTG